MRKPKNVSGGSRTKGDWHRDEEAGRYHLWNAYYKAIHAPAEGRDNLLYARVLSMMSDAQAYKLDDYTCLHEYLEPAVRAYDRAWASDGPKPTEKEYEKVRIEADPMRTFPQEFSCYPDFYRSELLYFDIGEYCILCSEIRVVEHRKEER